MLTEGEQNRLIQSNMDLAREIAAQFRGGDVPWEDLLSEATVALVQAARAYKPNGSFRSYAHTCIDGNLKNLVARWRAPLDPGWQEPDEKDYDWDIWSIPHYERWLRLTFTPEELAEQADLLRQRAVALEVALRFCSKRERRMIEALLRGERIDVIARTNGISYYKTGRSVLKRALKKLDGITAKMRHRAPVHRPPPPQDWGTAVACSRAD